VRTWRAISHRKEGLHLDERSHEGARLAYAPSPLQVLQRIQHKEQAHPLNRLVGSAHHFL